MALKHFNSVHGFSVGEEPVYVIDSNRDVVAGNITTSGDLAVKTAGNSNVLIANASGAALTGNLAVSGYANITGNLVSGNASLGNIAIANYVSGTLTTAAQPNITSVGTLGNLAISGALTTVDYVDYDTANVSNVASSVGRMIWNDGDGTLDLGLKGGNVVLQIGQEELLRVYNSTGNVLTIGQVVRINGAQGNRPSAVLAQANAEATSINTVGMVTETIAADSEGFVTVNGIVRGLDTTAFSGGEQIYLSPTTAGGYTATKPSAPDHVVVLGWITRVHASVGAIYIKVDNGYELDELHNVSIANATAGQTLVYSNSNVWVNQVLNYSNTAGTVTTAAQPNITSVGTLANLTSNGTINFTGAGNVSLGAVGNIKITGGSNNQFLKAGANGAVSWATVKKYAREWHVDPYNGSDSNDGSYQYPFASLAYVANQAGNTGEIVYLHEGTYTDSVTFTQNNIDIVGVASTKGGLINITGNVTLSPTTSSLRVSGVTFANVTSSTTQVTYFDNVNVNGAFTKSGNGYCQVTNSSLQGSGGVSITGSGQTTIVSSLITNLTANNASATITVQSAINLTTAINTAGILVIKDSFVFANSATNAAITSSSGSFVYIYNSSIVNASGTVGKVSIGGYWSINQTQYDSANSTLNVYNLGTVNYSDAITTAGNLTVGYIANLGAVANVVITGGSNGQYLKTNGSGSLSFGTVTVANIVSGNSNVTVTANGNVTTYVAGNATARFTVTSTGIVANGTANISGNVAVGNLNVASGGAVTVNSKQAVNGPMFSAYANASTSIPNDTLTKVNFQVEEYDTNNNFANSRFTPTVEGYYQLNATVRIDGSSGSGEMMINLYKNGTEYKRGWNSQGTTIATGWWSMSVSTMVYANGSSDYFEIYVQQGSGASRNTTAGAPLTWFNGCMIRGA